MSGNCGKKSEKEEQVSEGFTLDQGCVLSWVVLVLVGLFVMQ
jgi:hypothetical protein